MAKLLCIVMAFMMMFSLTTALFGNPAPTVRHALEKISEIKVDVADTFQALVKDGTPFAYFEIETDFSDMDIIEKALYEFKNMIATSANMILGAVNMIVAVVAVSDDILTMLIGVIEVGVYLLFGFDPAENAIPGIVPEI